MRASYVGRATFYRLFDNLSDVLAYQCDQVFEDAASEYYEQMNRSADSVSLHFINSWMRNEKLLEAIVTANRFDILHSSHNKFGEIMNKIYFPEVTLTPFQSDYLKNILTMTMVAALSTWIQHGRKESAQQLYQCVKDNLQLICQMLV